MTGSPRLVAFVRDLSRFVRDGSEGDVRRALCSPFSGVNNVDARALCVAAGTRHTIADLAAREHAHGARAFVRALAAVSAAYAAQGATVGEHLTTIALVFAFESVLDDGERATFDRIVALGAGLDARAPAGTSWDPAALLAALDTLGAATLPSAAQPAPLPLARRAPERRRNVKRRRGHFSASSLGMFAECERRWFYRYVCEAVEDRGSPASFYGTAFHWALERFHGEYARADAAPPEELERKLMAHLGASFDRYRSGFETPVAFELSYRRAKRTARRYLRWFLERSRARPFEVIGTETAVELDLGGYGFIGYIDRLDRDDATGGVTVIDYKTGSIAESARAYRTKVAQYQDFQLPFYYWARTAAGDRVTRLALVPLKSPTLDVVPIELEVAPGGAPPASTPSYSRETTGTIGIDELERARTKMIELAALLADGEIEDFPATRDPAACTYCAYRAACRRRPPACEERFGR